MTETQNPTHTTTVDLPDNVAAFFAVLNTEAVETLYVPGSHDIRIRLDANNLYDLSTQVSALARAVSQVTGTIAAIDRPREDADGTYVAVVPASDDVASFFDILLGQAQVNFDPADTHATVVFYESDEYALSETVASLVAELDSALGYSSVMIERPAPIHATV